MSSRSSGSIAPPLPRSMRRSPTWLASRGLSRHIPSAQWRVVPGMRGQLARTQGMGLSGGGEDVRVDLILRQRRGVGDQALELVHRQVGDRLEQLLVGPAVLARLLGEVGAGARRSRAAPRGRRAAPPPSRRPTRSAAPRRSRRGRGRRRARSARAGRSSRGRHAARRPRGRSARGWPGGGRRRAARGASARSSAARPARPRARR